MEHIAGVLIGWARHALERIRLGARRTELLGLGAMDLGNQCVLFTSRCKKKLSFFLIFLNF